MNRIEMIQHLLDGLKKPAHKHEELLGIFENYKALLLVLEQSDPGYRAGLRILREELPDMERIIAKKHDPILKGRLTDALVSFRNKITALEELGQPEGKTETPVEPATEEKRIRNMPNLGMS